LPLTPFGNGLPLPGIFWLFLSTLALLAKPNVKGLSYAGSAFIGLSGSERAELSVRLQRSKLERCPIPKLRIPDAQWVKPQVMARVRHLSASKYLRHGTVRGFK